MSTRSRIAILLQDGSYRSIYCHFDGDLVGQILREYFPSEQDALGLINLGDISYITKEGVKSYKEMDDPWQKVKPQHSSDLQALTVLACNTDAEYLYYWQEGQWHTIKMSW